MQISLEDIRIYSKCPRQYFYGKSVPFTRTEDRYRSIIKTVIRQSYINRSQHNYDPQWETIKTRINKLYFENVDVSRKEIFDPIYRQSVATMATMHYWYHKIFLNDMRSGIVNIPMNVDISNSSINFSMDILLDNKYEAVPLLFNDYNLVPVELSNDIEFKSLLYLFYKATDLYPKVVEYGIITQDSVKYQKVFSKTPIDTIEKYVNFIVRGMENKIFYPSVNEQCSSCRFKDICTI